MKKLLLKTLAMLTLTIGMLLSLFTAVSPLMLAFNDCPPVWVFIVAWILTIVAIATYKRTSEWFINVFFP
jgi:hypothetical protein